MARTEASAALAARMATLPTKRARDDADLPRPAPTQPVPSSTAARLELSSSAARTPKDHLSSMPPELLSRVFAHSDYRKPITGPLLAYTRANRYRNIHITTNEALQTLCDMIAMNAQLGSFVEALVAQRIEDPSPMKGEIIALFYSLDRLERLEVSGQLVNLILHHEVATTCFPRLERLTLDDPFDRFINPLDPARFSCIEHYQRLTFLKVTIDGYDSETVKRGTPQVTSYCQRAMAKREEWGRRYGMSFTAGPVNEDRAPVSLQLGTTGDLLRSLEDRSRPARRLKDDSEGTILQLHLTAPASDPRTLKFVEHFKSLVNLTLTNCTSIESNFTPFLSHYTRASSIERLCLISKPYDPTAVNTGNDISVGLNRFTALRLLVLDTPHFSPAIFHHLRDPLPLTHLTIGRVSSSASIADLQALFLPGPTRLTSLECLHLDIPYIGRAGTRIIDAGPYFPDGSDEANVHPDWRQPVWYGAEDFDLNEVKTLQALAHKAGVIFNGTVLQAIGVMDLWVDEQEALTTGRRQPTFRTGTSTGGDSEELNEDANEGQDDRDESSGAFEE